VLGHKKIIVAIEGRQNPGNRRIELFLLRFDGHPAEYSVASEIRYPFFFDSLRVR
jgi:hypothetical protein